MNAGHSIYRAQGQHHPRVASMPGNFILLVLPLLSLAGCAVGPNYHRPSTALPDHWSQEASIGVTNGPAEVAAWWANFHDPELNSLVERAAGANFTFRAAQSRVKAARALRGAVIADLFPTVGMNASYVDARRSANALAFPVQLLDTDTFQAGFDATWELDVFGGKRRALEVADANLRALVEDQRDVLVSLLAEVARNYIEARGYQRRLEIARKNLEAQQEAVNIAQLRFHAGLSSELDLAQAKALLAATKSQVPTLEVSLQETVHHLAVLVGQPPGGLQAELGSTAAVPSAPPSVPVGLPSDLLLRRPDVRRSEQQLAAATAQIGVATAELFPKFSLIGSAGFQSLNLGNLVSPASEFWNAGPTVTWRLLEYPRLRSTIRSDTALQEQALNQYYQTVLSSLEDVENALVAYGKEHEHRDALDEAVQNDRRALELANDLYIKGLGEFLNVLDSERSLYLAEDQLAQSEQTVAINLISLYKALGGGWETAEAKSDQLQTKHETKH